MPLQTRILRDGEPLPLRWGDFHVACMALASCFDRIDGLAPTPDDVYDAPPGTFFGYPDDVTFPVSQQLSFMLCTYPMLAKTPLGEAGHDGYTLTGKHRFRDVQDGEILELLPGDVLIAFREF